MLRPPTTAVPGWFALFLQILSKGGNQNSNKLTKLGRCYGSTKEMENNSNASIVKTAGRASWNCQDIP